ncbi:hypothetical protein [Inediibacterium massiliense]|uniref:hypothetical protein n=1 Tax=Inediibacterium massiliense TaxID=1658111 RepID=UPI0006B512CF|nr:hypothetical protein [Inediibacterium massiliense]
MEKILQQILHELAELKQNQIQTNNRLDNMESDIKDLKQGQAKLEQGQAKLEQGQQEIKDYLIQLDTKNADRHREINHKIDNLSKDLTVVEAVTGKNMTDIAHLKSIK